MTAEDSEEESKVGKDEDTGTAPGQVNHDRVEVAVIACAIDDAACGRED